MTFKEFEKKYKSDPKFRKEKTDNFVELLQFLTYAPTSFGITPKQLAAIIVRKNKDEINSRQAKDCMKNTMKANQDFYKENKPRMEALTKELENDISCLIKQ